MISSSDNVKLKTWWTYQSQKKMIYLLARDLLLAEDVAPEEAIKTSQDFHNLFHKMVIEYNE